MPPPLSSRPRAPRPISLSVTPPALVFHDLQNQSGSKLSQTIRLQNPSRSDIITIQLRILPNRDATPGFVPGEKRFPKPTLRLDAPSGPVYKIKLAAAGPGGPVPGAGAGPVPGSARVVKLNPREKKTVQIQLAMGAKDVMARRSVERIEGYVVETGESVVCEVRLEPGVVGGTAGVAGAEGKTTGELDQAGTHRGRKMKVGFFLERSGDFFFDPAEF